MTPKSSYRCVDRNGGLPDRRDAGPRPGTAALSPGDPEGPVTRRTVLRAITGTGITAGLAGCILSGPDNGGATATPSGGPAEAVEITVDPRGTYLRTTDDDARPPTTVSLSTHDIGPGDTITIERIGTWDPNAPDDHRGRGVIGVFSATDTILDSNSRHRVPDAIDAGPDITTKPTFLGENPTDIPEDFAIATASGSRASVTVTVPRGAKYLFVAANDVLYEDNSDTITVRITTNGA